MNSTTMTLAIMTLAGTALAQPAVFTDLGDRTTTQTFTQAVTLAAANDIQWFRIELPQVSPAAGWVDIWTSAPGDITDSEIGLYDATGAGAGTATTYFDDDSGAGNLSQLTFGSTTPRPLIPGAAARNGSDGALAGGVYYLAVGRFNVTFAPSFTVTSTYAGVERTTTLNFDIQAPTDPFPPTIAVASDTVAASAGSTVLYTATVVPGGNPASTGLTVVGDLSSVGGSATAAFHDDGLNGDATAGDNVFSFQHTFPAVAADNIYSLPVTVTDAQSRTASATISAAALAPVTWDETANGAGDAGQDLASAQSPTGTGTALSVITGSFAANDVDIYRISVCNTANFRATTSFTFPRIDTQLFLFRPDGTGVVVNDDVPDGLPAADTTTSTITNALVTATGEYFLAVGRYNIDPVDASNALLWANTPFNTERAPDGPGAANPFASWTGAVAGTANYRITLTGACFAGGTGPICGAADLGSVGGVPGADNHLDNNDFVVFIDFFFAQNALADQGSTGGVPGADGVWDNNDFVVFIDNFFNAPASCR
ncbi:MAG TPA: GC-type dockerin domain-anchored protein [Phycisphaerales bacterium]|nr:GC-type dockerin domain-anchored protein [Phycisphaerales bacterium]